MTELRPARSQMSDDEIDQMRLGYMQQIQELQNLLNTMQVKRNDLNGAAFEVAKAVDDIFVRSHESASQRTSRVQIIVREAMRTVLEGEKYWNWNKDYTFAREPTP